jgi:tryptophanase
VKTVRPVGGHAVFIDAADFCPHIAAESASHALACAIYEHTGIRCTRIGSVLHNQSHSRSMELVRLAIPRRTYTQAHLEHVAASIVRLKRDAARIEPRPLPHDLEPARSAPVLAAV